MLPNLKSYMHLFRTYSTQKECLDLLEKILWEGKPVSPFDSESTVYRCGDNKYKCRKSGKYFNVLKGTMFEGTKLPLTVWFQAVWHITTSGAGMTSVTLATNLGISQKSAWFMLHRIRVCMEVENNHTLSETVECDETWIGGKNKNRHKSKKVDYSKGENPDKSLVIGMLQRNGNIVCKVIGDRSKECMQPEVVKYVSNGANLITDEHGSYSGLEVVYRHNVINHSAYEYVSLSDRSLHNNGIEGAWSHLKKTTGGTYKSVSKKHLQLYVDEYAYRRNTRDLTPSDKFHWLLFNCSTRTKFSDLPKKVYRKPERCCKVVYRSNKKNTPKQETINQLQGDLLKFKRNGKI